MFVFYKPFQLIQHLHKDGAQYSIKNNINYLFGKTVKSTYEFQKKLDSSVLSLNFSLDIFLQEEFLHLY